MYVRRELGLAGLGQVTAPGFLVGFSAWPLLILFGLGIYAVAGGRARERRRLLREARERYRTEVERIKREHPRLPRLK